MAGRRRPPRQGRPGRPQRPQRPQSPGQRGRATQRPLRRVGDGPDHRHRPPASRGRQPRRLQVHGQRARIHRPRPLPATGQPLYAHHRPGPDRQPGPAQLPRQQRRRRARRGRGPVGDPGGHHQITRSKIVGQPAAGPGNGQRAERILPEPLRLLPRAPRPVPADPDLAPIADPRPHRPSLRHQRRTHHQPPPDWARTSGSQLTQHRPPRQPPSGLPPSRSAPATSGLSPDTTSGRLRLCAGRYLGEAVGAGLVRRHDVPATYLPSAVTGNTSRYR